MKPLVSIIVPVYESMRDLKDSVDSILAQTYENIEILLVDSDSKDGSAALCRDYEIQNQRVRFFSKEDEGVSASRNLGIRMAQGDYLQFADSDDVLLPKASEILVKHMEQSSADIVIGGYRMRKEGAEKSPKPE